MSTDHHGKLQSEPEPGENPDFPGNRAFAPALLDPDLDIPAGMVGPDGNTAPKRFAVYRNNVVSSLIEAMTLSYPAVRKIIGEENFTTVARIFISRHPPDSPMMQAYGAKFPEFLRQFKPLQHSPFLVDLANLENNWIAAYHACDGAILNGQDLAGIEPDALMRTRFEAHPATCLIASQYRLYDMFASRDDEADPQINYDKCQSIQAVLITRPHLSVEINRLDHAGAEFFGLLVNRHTLGEAAQGAISIDSEFDISSAIALMLSSGAMAAISNPQTK